MGGGGGGGKQRMRRGEEKRVARKVRRAGVGRGGKLELENFILQGLQLRVSQKPNN